MNDIADHYKTLGVLPDSEQIVISAAYRALAGLYHPDRWKGNLSDSTQRMAEINVAYSIIGDAEKRAKYNQMRVKTHSKFDESDESTDVAFNTAINDFESRWLIAAEVFPDLHTIRKDLSKTSHKLAFAFVVQVIENKQFASRHELARTMEHSFLERHFGTNQEILDYAKKLIYWGFKDAIKRLNSFVDVLGSDVDPNAIITRVESELKLVERREKLVRESSRARAIKNIETLRNKLLLQPISEDTFHYARLIGYEVDMVKGSLFWPTRYTIRIKNDQNTIYETHKFEAMCLWIKGHLT